MTSNQSASRGGSRLVIAVGFVVALLVAGFAGWFIGTGAHVTARRLPVLGKAPHYTLKNQLGQPVNSDKFAGKIQIVTFLFPYCTTYCPLIAAHLAGFEHTLARTGLQDKVQIVAFDVDPGGTGPVQMRAFLKEFGWNPHDLHWQYLTGTPAQVRKVVTGGYHIAYEKVSNNAPPSAAEEDTQNVLTPQPTVVNRLANKVKPDYDVTHNDGMEIVDGHGRIRKIYEDADMVSGKQLLTMVQALLHTTSASTR